MHFACVFACLLLPKTLYVCVFARLFLSGELSGRIGQILPSASADIELLCFPCAAVFGGFIMFYVWAEIEHPRTGRFLAATTARKKYGRARTPARKNDEN